MRHLYFLFIFLLSEMTCWAEPLKVGAILQTPFVIKYDTTHSGIAVELWDSIARGLNQTYSFVEYSEDKTEEAFDALKKGEIDVLIGALSITSSGLEKADFTLPYYVDKVVPIVSHDYFRNLYTLFEMMFISFGWILGLFFVLFILYLYSLWYYEQSSLVVLSKDYRKGIAYLFWKHVLTGRHADEIPKSLQGKILILFKVVLFYFAFTLLSATIISFLTVALSEWTDPIKSFSDLERRQVGAIAESRPFKIGKIRGLKMIPFSSIKEGIQALEGGQIGAFLSDFSLADGYLKEVGRNGVDISHFVLKQDLHSFAVKIGSPLLRKINEQMIQLRKNQIPTKICKGYLEKGVRDCDL